MHNFVFIPILFGLGIGTYFALPFEPNKWITLVVIELLIILAIFWRYYKNRLIVIGYIAVFVLGFANIQLKSIYMASQMPIKETQNLYINGQVSYKDYNSRGAPRYTLENIKDIKDNALFEKIRVSAYGSEFDVGECFEGVVKIMPPYKAPFFGAYDFSKKAFYSGLQANGYAITKIYETKCDVKKTSIINNIRKKIIANIEKYVPKEEAGIVSALVAGEKGKIPQKVLNQYRDSGLAHVLSISGMHMSMIAGFMFLLVRTLLVFVPNFALKYNIKRISAIVAMIVATFYLLISGAMVPTQRAYIMVFIVLLGAMLDREAISIKNISIAALIILAISPEVLVSPSFQMSFAAVFAMIAFYEKFSLSINRFIKKFGFIISYIVGLLIADFVASVATLPFSIYHFNNIALYTTLGNLLAGPVIGLVIMPFILLSLLLMPLGLSALPLKVVSYGVGVMNDICSYVSSLDGARVYAPSMPTWAFCFIVIGGLVLCVLQNKKRLFGIGFILVGFLSMLFYEKPIAVNLEKPSSFNKMLVNEKYGEVKITTNKPYGAVIYKNKVKEQKFNRIWNKN